MSLCVECNAGPPEKTNGHPFCDKCDPKGELNSQADDPSFQNEIARKRRRDELEKELAQLDGGPKS